MKQVLLLAAAFLLVLLNGFFVAAEFAIVKVRSTKIRELAEAGDWRATMARNVIDHLDAYLSACQLGITIASLGLGWIGEPAVARLIEPALRTAGVTNETLIHTAAFTVAFIIISFQNMKKVQAYKEGMKELTAARLKTTKSRSFIVEGL